ncbi:MAG: hypothetical protein CMJ46_14815, partial [Planctomyces sp.]|nr:hypothetical protein [Planctomyces sp.]
MNLLSVLPVCPAVLLSTTLLLPSRVANRIPVKAGKIVRLLLGIQSVMAAILAICVIPGGLVGLTGMPEAIFVGSVELFHLDALACLMFLLISFIGWSVAHFSIRYLDGEPKQGAYFRWLSLAIGMVSIMAISGNLLMLVAAGLIASLAMHQLMVFYKDRTMAQRAAWTKFVISRLGDALLLMACGILYQSAGTLNLTNLFAQSNWATIPDGNLFEIAMGLFVVGALVKSAQFPFHIWLPVSLETPTPVSALMHAGIVNAGGFLLIRISPLVSQVPSVLVIAAVTGLVTAVYGSLVMVTQTSVKKRLAYSTVAQMGFMMLQCGLGAFTAA